MSLTTNESSIMDKKNPFPVSPNDLAISGMVLGFQNDTITYTSRKTGKEETLTRDVVILKTSFGIVICRFFNPSLDVKSILHEGDTVSVPVSQYSVENGLKTATVRV